MQIYANSENRGSVSRHVGSLAFSLVLLCMGWSISQEALFCFHMWVLHDCCLPDPVWLNMPGDSFSPIVWTIRFFDSGVFFHFFLFLSPNIENLGPFSQNEFLVEFEFLRIFQILYGRWSILHNSPGLLLGVLVKAGRASFIGKFAITIPNFTFVKQNYSKTLHI